VKREYQTGKEYSNWPPAQLNQFCC